MNLKLKIIICNLLLLTCSISYTMNRHKQILQEIKKNETSISQLKNVVKHWNEQSIKTRSSMKTFQPEIDFTRHIIHDLEANLRKLTEELKFSITSDNLIKEIISGNLANVKNLIAENADVNKFDSKGNTPLMYAAGQGDFNIVQLLLGAGANVNAVNKKGNITALHEAVSSGNPSVVKFLILSGADSRIGMPVLNLAISTARAGNPQDLEIIKILINAGQKVTKDAANFAASRGLSDIADALRSALSVSSKTASPLPSSATSSISSTTTQSVSSSSITSTSEKIPTIPTPSTAGSLPKSNEAATKLLISKITEGDLEEINKLITEKIDPNIYDPSTGSTPLMYAAEAGLNHAILLLVKGGVNINAINTKQNATALHYAVQSKRPETVELLLRLGVNPNIGTSLLGLAITHAKKFEDNPNDLRIITALLEGGATIESWNIARAENHGLYNISNLLIEEPDKRDLAIKKYIETILNKKITAQTKLPIDLSKIIGEYHMMEYTDIPLEQRLSLRA